MAEEYNIKRTSFRTAILGDRVIAESQDGITRKIARFEVVENPRDPEARLHLTLVHQRKRKNDSWEDLPATPFSSLKAGEAAKFELDSATTRKLVEELTNALAISGEPVRIGAHKVIVGREEEVVRTEPEAAKAIGRLLAKAVPAEAWDALLEADEDWVLARSHAQIHKERVAALAEFEAGLSSGAPESFWQDFFDRNTWIFGYGLNYHVLRPVQAQPHYGGTRVDGRGSQRGDFLETTGGDIKFTVLLDIKKPTTALFGSESYRNGAWSLGVELTGGVAQLQANCATWEHEGSRSTVNAEDLSEQKIYTVQPKGILIAGDTAQLNNGDKRGTFERFRRNLTNPEILTFDEVLDRARFIVGNTK